MNTYESFRDTIYQEFDLPAMGDNNLPVDRLNHYITIMEDRLARYSHSPQLESTQTVMVPAGTSSMTLSERTVNVKSVIFNGVSLRAKTIEIVRVLGFSTTTVGDPEYYYLQGSPITVNIAPFRNEIMPLEITTKSIPESIVTATASWFLADAYDALYSLVSYQVAIHLGSDEDVIATRLNNIRFATEGLLETELIERLLTRVGISENTNNVQEVQ